MFGRLFEQYASGKTVTEIIQSLNARQIKTSQGKRSTRTACTACCGTGAILATTSTKGWKPQRDAQDLEDELFERVQHILDCNKKAPARTRGRDEYLLTTKLFCGYCGALMFGESGTSRTGEVHRYYKCATAKKHKGCKKKTVRKQWLEDLVVNQTMQLVRDDAAMESIIAKVMELQNKEKYQHSSL